MQSEIVVLKEEGYCEQKISKKLNINKTSTHNATVKHKIDEILTTEERSGRNTKSNNFLRRPYDTANN